MKHQIFIICLFIAVTSILLSCEKEKTDYKQTWDSPFFKGFQNGLFIVHSSSIDYYYPDSDKIARDIFKIQNGSGIGNDIHSFSVWWQGIITVEDENKVEFVDVNNFISSGSLEMDHPRNIYLLGEYSLITFGNNISGGVALVDVANQALVMTIGTDNEAGQFYPDDHNNFYIFCSGKNLNDSAVSVLYGSDLNKPQTIHSIDTIVIGIRPVDFVEISLNFDSQHKGLAILCMGNQTVPASIVIFDLVTRKVVETYHFDKPDFKPESIFWIGEPYSGSRKLAVNANGKLYQTELSDPMVTSVLIDKNLSDFYRYDKTYLAVSRDTINPVSYMYKFDVTTLDLLDSIPIDGKAKEIAGSFHDSRFAGW
jgi:hypothetical protein